MNDRKIISDSVRKRRTILNAVGAVMLLTGVISAGAAVLLQRQHTAGKPGSSFAANGWKDDTLAPEDSKSSSRQSEMLYGKVGSLTVRFWLLVEKFVSRENFATGFAVILLVVATCCFAAADRL